MLVLCSTVKLAMFHGSGSIGLKHCATAVVFKVTVVLLSQAQQYSCSTMFETGLKDLQN